MIPLKSHVMVICLEIVVKKMKIETEYSMMFSIAYHML